MSENTERFTGRSATYERYRERYDPEVVLPLLREWCGLQPGWTVADVGAGTGMLSDVFLTNGNRVVAVEPNAEMRALCERLHAGSAELAVADGTAERTGLPESSVEMVSVGRALHWFDLTAALREFWRVLRPGGWVVVVALGRAKGVREENEALEALLRQYTRDGEPTQASYVVYQEMERAFAGGVFHHAEVKGELRLRWEELLGLTMSLSHSPLPEDVRFGEFERQLRSCFDRYESGGAVTLATRYWVNAGRFGD